jgi:hypothetical protein
LLSTISKPPTGYDFVPQAYPGSQPLRKPIWALLMPDFPHQALAVERPQYS